MTTNRDLLGGIRDALSDLHEGAHPAAWCRGCEAQAVADELFAKLDKLEAACGGLLWLDNNIHNYGTDAWRDYFLTAVADARQALDGGNA